MLSLALKKESNILEVKDSEHDVAIYHIENLKRKIEYISRNAISKNTQDIDKFKVLLTGAAGSGNDKMVLGKPILTESNSVCSQSFLYVPFDTKDKTNNFFKYLKTKFFRALVASIKITQSCPNRVYQFVPIQDFSNKSDIDWNKPIDKIDDQLYKKYKLEKTDIDYIDKMIEYFDE